MKKLLIMISAAILTTTAISPVYAQTPPPEAIATAVPSATPSPEADPLLEGSSEVNSFEIFWPITAGRTMGDSLYFLKSLKESFRELLMFSSFKKADYNITLSVKRLVEAEKLLIENKDNDNGKKSLEAAQAKREKALDFIKKAEAEGRYVVDLKTTLKNSLEKQRALLQSLIAKVDESGKSILEDNVSVLNKILAEVEG